MECSIRGPVRVIQSVQRAFGLVERLAAAPEGLRLSELADGADLNRSTAHNLLASLDAIGWVEQPSKGGPYRLTGRMGQLMWRRIEAEEVLRARVHPILESLSAQTGETAYLAFASGEQYLCADAVESSEPLHLTVKIGEREPLLGTAIGHALLAADAALAERMASADSTGWAESAPAVADAAAQGFAVDEDAFHPGVSCVAVVVGFGAAIGVAGPSSRLSGPRLADIARQMLHRSRDLD
ncbi:IclR family transcriptional regulator [Microbacterium saperdae]|uniref:IclR family transcriptional regulator n=1 Tax=Microbacterium saperdae TaxID=69368 RepID=A0A543BLD5_9MICO|nr:helix-turn-helix domain-containing protein [Microbacterium saperdae]TQL85614.1 IclR family transcriptional regulator [Microbacterium saperdae]GGM62217.1 transcriptional regulator [Microbacterium saperdae]